MFIKIPFLYCECYSSSSYTIISVTNEKTLASLTIRWMEQAGFNMILTKGIVSTSHFRLFETPVLTILA